MKKLLVLSLLVLACGRAEKPAAPVAPSTPKTPPAPSVQQASELIANSAELSEYQFTNAATTIPLERAAMNEPARATADALTRAGWVAWSGDKLVLTEKAKRDKRFLERPNGSLDVVPLAKKEFGAVTSVTPNADGTVSAAFTWKWSPNEVGQAFRSGPLHDRYAAGDQKATAKLLWDGSAWSVLRIDP